MIQLNEKCGGGIGRRRANSWMNFPNSESETIWIPCEEQILTRIFHRIKGGDAMQEAVDAIDRLYSVPQ